MTGGGQFKAVVRGGRGGREAKKRKAEGNEGSKREKGEGKKGSESEESGRGEKRGRRYVGVNAKLTVKHATACPSYLRATQAPPTQDHSSPSHKAAQAPPSQAPPTQAHSLLFDATSHRGHCLVSVRGDLKLLHSPRVAVLDTDHNGTAPARSRGRSCTQCRLFHQQT